MTDKSDRQDDGLRDPVMDALRVACALSAAPPKPAPDAMREALADRIKREWPCCAHNKRDLIIAAISAPVPPADGAGMQWPRVYSVRRTAENSWHACIAFARFPTDDELKAVEAALSPSPAIVAEPGVLDAFGWLLDAIKSEGVTPTPLLKRRFEDAERTLLRALATPPVRGDRETLEKIIEAEMLDAWNEICSDTDCHPLDIEQLGRRKLGFHNAHWSRLTAERSAERFLSLPVQPGAGEREPTPDMRIAGGIAWAEAAKTAETYVDCAEACWKAMWDALPVREQEADIEGMVSGPYHYKGDVHTSFRVSILGHGGRLVASVFSTAGEDQAEADAVLFARALRQAPHSGDGGGR